jgi:hypothetical protein
LAGAVLGGFLVLLSGCTGLPQPLPDRPARLAHGYVYYLDGA